MDGILSPAFLQAACAKAQHEEPVVPMEITLKALQADPTITAVTSTGEIAITTVKGGESVVRTSPALTSAALTIEADDEAIIELSAEGLVIDTLGDQVELVTE